MANDAIYNRARAAALNRTPIVRPFSIFVFALSAGIVTLSASPCQDRECIGQNFVIGLLIMVGLVCALGSVIEMLISFARSQIDPG